MIKTGNNSQSQSPPRRLRRSRAMVSSHISYAFSTVLLALLASLPSSNAFLAASPATATRALCRSSIRQTGLTAAGNRIVLPGTKVVRSVGMIRNRNSIALDMSAEAAVDVEQKGIVTVYYKETCPYCKKVSPRTSLLKHQVI